MTNEGRNGWSFGPFHFDPVTGRLQGAEKPCTLLPKDSLVLEYLLQAGGALVSKEALHAHCWPQQAVVGGDVLKTSIRRLRQALGDDFHAPHYIETINRRGYRFLLAAHHDRSAALPAGSSKASLALPMAPPDFIGRDEELNQLHNLFASTQSGAFHLVAISGEAGEG